MTPEIGAEAAVWVARLHGPERSSRMERECLAWQARSTVHCVAFERCTDSWQDVGRVTLSADAAAAGDSGSGAARKTWLPSRTRWALALVALVLGMLFVQQPWRDVDTCTTGVSEQQTVVLHDGTRMSLNTAARVRMELGSAQRTVRIEGGEALFEVAKDAHRPFVVRAAGSEVVVLGTAFAVRLAPERESTGDPLAVTLIEGQVTIRPAPGSAEGTAPARPLFMQPGERVRLSEAADAPNKGAKGATIQVDRPRIDQVMAWKRSEAVFDDVSLSEAVAEMNRYSRTPIVLLGDKSLTRRRVSGLFRTGDNAGYARAVAAVHGLVVQERPDRLELAPG